MVPSDLFQQACQRIQTWTDQKNLIRRTPVTYDPDLDLYLKWENQQITGSFKARGALNKMLSLTQEELDRGLVTASAGNHGQGVALAAAQFGARVVVFASDHAVLTKINAMRVLGAEVRFVAGGYEQAEQTAIAYARENGNTWVSPYNDLEVIAGQSTIAFELLEQIQPFNARAILVPVGGGGLAAGVASVIKTYYKDEMKDVPRVIAVQSEASAYFHRLFYHDSQNDVVEVDSIADGLAGRVEDGSVTIPMVKKHVDEVILVREEEIAEAVRFAWNKYRQVIEGSSATVLAAILTGKVELRPVVLVISGGNILSEVHAGICGNSGLSGQ